MVREKEKTPLLLQSVKTWENIKPRRPVVTYLQHHHTNLQTPFLSFRTCDPSAEGGAGARRGTISIEWVLSLWSPRNTHPENPIRSPRRIRKPFLHDRMIMFMLCGSWEFGIKLKEERQRFKIEGMRGDEWKCKRGHTSKLGVVINTIRGRSVPNTICGKISIDIGSRCSILSRREGGGGGW
jgi:hypothetical protein